MLDKLISAGSVFDWITPVVTFIQDYQNRPSVGYNISVETGWSAYAIRDLLTGHGVKLWGLTIFSNIITFRVRKAQARYAQFLMEQEGIPYQGGIRETWDTERQKVRKKPLGNKTRRQPASQGIDGWVDKIARAFDD